MSKILAWNVNGLRSIIKKKYIVNNIENETNTFENFIKAINPDIVSLTETKLSCEHECVYNKILTEYPYKYWSHCKKTKSRNGVAVFSKIKPINVNIDLIDEGRYIEMEFDNYYLVSVYVPNSGNNLQRLQFRTEEWDSLFLNKLIKLKRKKNVLICGDMNVINFEYDTHSYKTQINKIAGITENEIENFHNLLNNGFIDIYRNFYPKKIEYSYFSYYTKGRSRNKGMRIDYFLCNESFLKNVKNISILNDIYGSDHLPILLVLKK